jgi:hypothetical protein
MPMPTAVCRWGLWPDRGERPRPRDHRCDPDGEQPRQLVPATGASSAGPGPGRAEPSWYWLWAARIGEDVIGGRVFLAAEDGERRNFHRSVRALPAARGYAGRITCRYDIAGHGLNSRLCRVPERPPYRRLILPGPGPVGNLHAEPAPRPGFNKDLNTPYRALRS